MDNTEGLKIEKNKKVQYIWIIGKVKTYFSIKNKILKIVTALSMSLKVSPITV